MAVIQTGSSTSGVQNVDTKSAAFVVARPMDHSTLGHYHIAMTSGTVAAALAAGTASAGHVFAFRNSHASILMVVTRLWLRFQTLTAFTAATVTDFGFDAYRVTSYSASHSGQTAATLTGLKKRSSFADSSIADIRISNTAALTNGTETFDGNAFANCVGDPNIVNAAAGTEYANQGSPPAFDWQPDVADGEYPLVLGQNEGIVIRNRTVWPAAGTGIIQVGVNWAEVTSY